MNTNRTNEPHWTSIAGDAARTIEELQANLEQLRAFAAATSTRVQASGLDGDEVANRLHNLAALDEALRRGKTDLARLQRDLLRVFDVLVDLGAYG
jgi:hypothetical protein